jgi:carboxyl-terminal processing protease
VILAAVVAGGFIAWGTVRAQAEAIIDELKLFSKAMGVILEGYVGEAPSRQLLYQAVKGMLGSLDAYSEFIDPERYELLKISMRGEYAGIGVRLEIIDRFPVIMEVQTGSAAEKAGLQVNDKILRVGAESMEGKKVPEVAALLRGEAGVPVNLTIWRGATQEKLAIAVVREIIEIPSVRDTRMVGRRVGYVWILDFQENTAAQFDRAIDELTKQGMRALIIDLRNNEGGLMPQAVELAERFLPQGAKIVSVESKISEQRKEHISTGTKTLADLPLVILVNELSASAAEIFSAAMQDNGRARIVGMKTFGKASVQSVIPLDDASAMKLTTARYKSPTGKVIDALGVYPDETVENGPADVPGSDHQTRRAVELLREYL